MKKHPTPKLVTGRPCPGGCGCKVWTPATPCDFCGSVVCVWCANASVTDDAVTVWCNGCQSKRAEKHG